MLVDVIKTRDSQTGRLSFINVTWVEKAYHPAFSKPLSLIGAIISFLIFVVLCIAVVYAFIIVFKSTMLSTTGLLATFSPEKFIQDGCYFIIMFILSPYLIVSFFGAFLKGLRGIRNGWIQRRSITINSDGSLDCDYGLPEDESTIIMRSIIIFFKWLVFVLILNGASYFVIVLSNSFYVALISILANWIIHFVVAVRLLRQSKSFRKEKITLFAEYKDFARAELDDWSNWIKKSESESKLMTESERRSLMDLKVIILHLVNGSKIFLSFLSCRRSDLSPIIVAITNAFEEMRPHIKAYQKHQQSKQGVSMTIGDTTVHVNPL